ncbi:MAG: virulence factor [Gammaproteobacteria bacterium]
MPSAKQIIIYWRDIPSQVNVKLRRNSGKVMLGNRFQVAIDRAAMRAGKGSSDAYIAEWRRESEVYTGDEEYQVVAQRIADVLEVEYPDERLTELIKNHGNAPGKPKDACVDG